MDNGKGELYIPQTGERQLTIRALIAGCLLGSGVCVINAYFGLKTGWSLSGALIAAIFGYLFFNCFTLKKNYTVLENNITETCGSAASMMIPAMGILTVLPALKMLGHPMNIAEMYIWGISTSFLGAFFAVPLRTQFIIIDRLRFPTGTATAEVIAALHLRDAAATFKSKLILWSSLFAGLYTLICYQWPVFLSPPFFQLIGLAAITAWGFSLQLSPLLIGAGIMIGPRIGLSLLLGAVISWGMLGPWAAAMHLTSGALMDYRHGVAGWILWPGVALLVSESIVNFILTFIVIIKNKKWTIKTTQNEQWPIPFRMWLIGFSLVTVCACMSLQWFFKIPFYFTLIAIAFSSILSLVAARSLGETEINPLTAVGKITQLAFGQLAPGQITTNLLAGGVAASSAAAAGDMLQDWKAGYLLGASPRAQFYAQLVGVAFGILVSVPIYVLFDSAYQIGSGAFPAPSAHGWQAMAELLSSGLHVLPVYSGITMFIAACCGCTLALLRFIKPLAPYVPSGVAMGIAFIVPAFYSLTMCLGSLFIWIWQSYSLKSADSLSFPLASGLIIGEGLMGAVVAVLTLLHR